MSNANVYKSHETDTSLPLMTAEQHYTAADVNKSA